MVSIKSDEITFIWYSNRLDEQIKALINKYVSSFFAFFSFPVEDSSAIGTTSAIISCSSFGGTILFDRAPPFRT